MGVRPLQHLAGPRRRIQTKELMAGWMPLHHYHGQLLSRAERPDALRRNPTPLTPYFSRKLVIRWNELDSHPAAISDRDCYWMWYCECDRNCD